MTDLEMPVSQGTRDWWDRLANGRPYTLVRHDSIRPGDRAISSYHGEVTATAYIGDGIDGHQGQINWVTPESASGIWHERCDNDVPIALLTRAEHNLPPERHTLACIRTGHHRAITYPDLCDCQTTGALTTDELIDVIETGLVGNQDDAGTSRRLAGHLLAGGGRAIRSNDWAWALPDGRLAPGRTANPGYLVLTEDDLTAILNDGSQACQDGTGTARHLAGHLLANGVKILADAAPTESTTYLCIGHPGWRDPLHLSTPEEAQAWLDEHRDVPGTHVDVVTTRRRRFDPTLDLPIPERTAEAPGAPRSTDAQRTLPEHLLVGKCARCGAPCIIPATDPDNAEMEVCAACHGDVIRDLTNGTAEGR